VFGSSARGVKAFSFLFSSFGICSLFGGLLSAKLQETTEEPFKHIIQISQVLSIIAIATLIYYGNVLKNYDSVNKTVIMEDDEFQRVDEFEIRQESDVIEMKTSPSNVFVKKQILSQMINREEYQKACNLNS